MTSTQPLRKSIINLNRRELAVYYTPDPMQIKFVKDAHNGWEVRLDGDDQDAAIREIEGRV